MDKALRTLYSEVLTVSRGGTMFEQVTDFELQDEHGKRIRFGDLLGSVNTLFVFVRHFG